MKKFYESRTFWLAVVQASIAVLGIVLTHNPMYENLAIVLMAKAVLDIALRTLTTKEITM